jgi:hypothetical protein
MGFKTGAEALAENLFGLADLVVAVTTGFLTSPSAFQLFAFDLPNELISQFPLVLIPVFLVPLSVLLHLASLTKLRRGALRDNDHREIARAQCWRRKASRIDVTRGPGKGARTASSFQPPFFAKHISDLPPIWWTLD